MTNSTNTVTCSFSMDREIYNAYKSIISKNGENVKGNIVKYMKSVIQYETPNFETIQAIEEVNQMKNSLNKKTYGTFAELLEDVTKNG